MPLYDYRCPNGHEFEAQQPVADRNQCGCKCGESANLVVLSTPRLDPKMGLDPDFPSAAAKWRKGVERRGRGADMTSANREVSEDVDREAYAQRKAMGEGKITVS